MADPSDEIERGSELGRLRWLRRELDGTEADVDRVRELVEAACKNDTPPRGVNFSQVFTGRAHALKLRDALDETLAKLHGDDEEISIPEAILLMAKGIKDLPPGSELGPLVEALQEQLGGLMVLSGTKGA